ncbi:MAG: hypothetical protein K1X48_09885 [Burkholderiaceae bacterium]|nr:hypothetical protein [Burkholderiaceae bacterium]
MKYLFQNQLALLMDFTRQQRLKSFLKPRLTIFLLPFIVVSLSACSAIGLAYNNADTLLLSQLDSYLDLDSRQELFAREKAAAFFAWHRQEELPEYASWLRSIKSKIASGASDAQIAQLASEVNLRMDKALQKLAPDLAELALTLSPTQLERLKEKYAENAAQLSKEYLSKTPAEQQEKRFESLLSSIQRLYGSLQAEQKERLRAVSDARPLNHKFLLAERLRRQQDVMETLARINKQRLSTEVATREIKALFERFSPSPDAQRRAYFEQVNQGAYRAIALMSNLATKEQRAFAQERLESWAGDLTVLVARK